MGDGGYLKLGAVGLLGKEMRRHPGIFPTLRTKKKIDGEASGFCSQGYV
jgi:hypothetical protein